MEAQMSIESEAREDLTLGEDAAETIVGGKTKKKKSVGAAKPVVVQPVTTPSAPSAPADAGTQTPYPVLEDEDCAPIRYSSSD